jgi:uncharacterized damage-inducible protein DinB
VCETRSCTSWGASGFGSLTGETRPTVPHHYQAKRDALFSPEAFPNVDALQSKWIEVELEQLEFVNRVTNKSLAKMLPFCETRLTLMHLMQHVINHSTYHRGQVALAMRQLGAEPLATDFHAFLLEHLGKSAMQKHQPAESCPQDSN